ncbi:MAG: hypothetical protein LH468_00990 [Nocardioides sp.]|nr:hypothetical protein [Nocardioides sp.]
MRAVKTLAVAVLGATLLAGCGMFGTGDPDPSGTGTDGGTSTGTTTAEPQGPTPEELSEQVLAAAGEGERAPAIGTGTGTTAGQAELTIEVTAVERIAAGTLVRMRFSGTPGDNIGGPADFGTPKYQTLYFARSLYLIDPAVTKTRYLPLQFEDYREACTCPHSPLELGSEPQTVTAIYPPLPETVTTVDLVANGFLTVAGLPVGG